MLVLTRKRTETIQIGDGVVITVMHTGRNSIKLGIEAPDEVRIVRGELTTDGERGPRGEATVSRPVSPRAAQLAPVRDRQTFGVA